MTDDKKSKSKQKPLQAYISEAQQRLKSSHKPQKNFNKPTNFRPQGRGR